MDRDTRKEYVMALAEGEMPGALMPLTKTLPVMEWAKKHEAKLSRDALVALRFQAFQEGLFWTGMVLVLLALVLVVATIILGAAGMDQFGLYAMTGAGISVVLLIVVIVLTFFAKKRAEGSDILRQFLNDVSSLTKWLEFPPFKMSESELRQRVRKMLVGHAFFVVAAEDNESRYPSRKVLCVDGFLWSTKEVSIELMRAEFDQMYQICNRFGLAGSQQSLFDTARHRFKEQNK
jgi:uncharacterized Tic20 family protein